MMDTAAVVEIGRPAIRRETATSGPTHGGGRQLAPFGRSAVARVASAIGPLLAALLVLTPVVWASTAETWTNGIYDYESDELAPVVAPDHVVAVHPNPVFNFDGAFVVVGRVILPEHRPPLDVPQSASHSRAPPLF
jgi:hypothetical protein